MSDISCLSGNRKRKSYFRVLVLGAALAFTGAASGCGLSGATGPDADAGSAKKWDPWVSVGGSVAF